MNTATYTCDDGYNLIGVSDRTCQANGAWSLTAPTCDRECFKQAYTTVTELSVVYVNKLALTCLHTYVLLAVDCGSLNNTANGLVSTSSGTTFMMTANYTCNTGYNIVGSESRTCEASGVWSGEAPVCNCIRLTDNHNYCALTIFSQSSDSFEQWINECHCQQLCLITGGHWILCPRLSH